MWVWVWLGVCVEVCCVCVSVCVVCACVSIAPCVAQMKAAAARGFGATVDRPGAVSLGLFLAHVQVVRSSF